MNCRTDFSWPLNMELNMVFVECGFHRPKAGGITWSINEISDMAAFSKLQVVPATCEVGSCLI